MAYRERLTLSWWWIVVIAGLILSVAIVYFVYQPPQVAGAVTLALVALAAAVTMAGATRIAVEPSGLRCGHNVLEPSYVGDARALSAEETRHRLGRGADTRGFLVTRFYVPRAVEVTVADPADPHPYWLVSSRHPEELAEAIRRIRP
ncbi:Protein of unknown function [Raineyella antarctica]|uniref:DUF3093 domain-containing protein n=1 Tax=Raineyella antarctica TaxID=1577474 RepID=A0A1G6GQ18_9ACTN|nr:DUF3093 domain-containing protein [Raineyella antarctica]SDB84044.1 Protein of unknown function [Raineyella antarctica]